MRDRDMILFEVMEDFRAPNISVSDLTTSGTANCFTLEARNESLVNWISDDCGEKNHAFVFLVVVRGGKVSSERF